MRPTLTARYRFTVLFFLACLSAFSQWLPVSAHTRMYFPQFADGGPPAQQWQTIFSFVNPNESPVAVLLLLFGNDGQPLPLDLGLGVSAQANFTVPSNGSRILRSRIASRSTVIGWAVALASLPLQATVAFRQLTQGSTNVEITAESTLPSAGYYSLATRFVGIALANPFNSTVSVVLTVQDSNGVSVGQNVVMISPGNHIAFNLFEKFPSLGSDFTGRLKMFGQSASDAFIAWTLNGDGNVISALPPGRLAWPISHSDAIIEAFLRIWDAAQRLNTSGLLPGTGFGSQRPTLNIDSTSVVNASGNASTVSITLALSQLISDSPSELATVVAHEVGHVYQFRNGGLKLFNANPEFDADIWGALLALYAGYDPYAAAGALGKLAMATGQAGLAQQVFDELNLFDAHASINTRIENVFDSLKMACSAPATAAACALYKSIIHPNLPPISPLARPPRRE